MYENLPCRAAAVAIIALPWTLSGMGRKQSAYKRSKPLCKGSYNNLSKRIA